MPVIAAVSNSNAGEAPLREWVLTCLLCNGLGCWGVTLANTVPQVHTAMLTSRMSLKLHAYLYQVHGGLNLLREACQA